METKVNVSNNVCTKTLREIWESTQPGKRCIAQNLYGAIFEMKGLADKGALRAYGVMHDSSPKDPGEVAMFEDDKNIWKRMVVKQSFYGPVLYNKDLNCIEKPITFYADKETARKDISQNFTIIAWEIETMPIDK